MWVSASDRAGITDAIASQLALVTHLEWLVEDGEWIDSGAQLVRVAAVRRGDVMGPLAQLTLVAPLSGVISARNPRLTHHSILQFREDPQSLIASPYDQGWLVEFQQPEHVQPDLMSAATYREYVGRLLGTE